MQEEIGLPVATVSGEDEMRNLFAAKAAAKEAERRRVGRKTTKIVLGAVLLVVVAILCTPLGWNPREPEEGSAAGLAAKAAQLSGGQDGGASIPSDGTPEGDARRADAQFAMDLMRYVQPEKQGQATKDPAPETK